MTKFAEEEMCEGGVGVTGGERMSRAEIAILS